MAPFPRTALFKRHYQFTRHFNDKATTFGSAKWIFSLGNYILPAQSSSLLKHKSLKGKRDKEERSRRKEEEDNKVSLE